LGWGNEVGDDRGEALGGSAKGDIGMARLYKEGEDATGEVGKGGRGGVR